MKVQIAYGTMRNQCPACAEVFSTLRNFDAHRTGKFGMNRRCMTPEEMLARGMRKDAGGNWRGEGPAQQQRARLFARDTA